MSRYHSYINSAQELVSAYNGTEPFASFLRKFFSANKKFGSKDRKMIAHLCYCFFRTGKLFEDAGKEEKFLSAVFLCSQSSNELLQHLKPEWNEQVMQPVHEKIRLMNRTFNASLIFPSVEELSEGIDAEEFALSHFVQPDLFLRIRPGQHQTVFKKLASAGISFEPKTETSIAVFNSTNIDQVIDLNKEAVVQDYSSQRVGELMSKLRGKNKKMTVWDCCAASGGKSIMANDLLSDIDLTVSDVRESILANLKKRFAEAGIKSYKSFVADLTEPVSKKNAYDLIIADVPCTGSGTWGRTPEQLCYFKRETINHYNSLQKKILLNSISSLKSGGMLLYITCSVFRKENEEVVEWMGTELHLVKDEMRLLKGYNVKADTMFAALLTKP